MSREARAAYAERQRRRADGSRAIAKLKRRLQLRFHPDRKHAYSSVADVLTAVSALLNEVLDTTR